MNVRIAEPWRTTYPDAGIGVLALDGVENPAAHPALAAHATAVEADLRHRWAGTTRADLNRLPELETYRRYYRRFGKSYHVQLQLESVALKGRPLRRDGALVLAMFATELRNLLLTAGHDLDAVQGDLTVGVAAGGEPYTALGGREVTMEPGDMHIRDGAGVLSSILGGPDDRTRLTPATRRAVFCVYAPAGITADAVERHLSDLAAAARLASPDATVLHRQVYTTPSA